MKNMRIFRSFARVVGIALVAFSMASAQDDSNQPVSPLAAQSGDCPHVVEWFISQSRVWPVEQLFIAGQLVPEAELREFLIEIEDIADEDLPGDVWLTEQLIAYKLNVAMGSPTVPEAAEAASSADILLTIHHSGLPSGLESALEEETLVEMGMDAGVLKGYNNCRLDGQP